MTQHYTATAKVFHWITAVAVIVLLALGWYMTTLDLSPRMLQLYSYHKWLGVTVLLITALRLVWRFTHPAPPFPDNAPKMMRMAAHAGHIALYALLLLMPVAGWIHSSAAGFPVVWFGVIPLPDPVGPNKPVSDLFNLLHWIGGWLMLALLIGHVGAALWHHIVKQDDVFTRMLPGRKGLTVLFLAGLMTPISSLAEAGAADNWQLSRESSEISFSARQMNVPIEGKFQTFDAVIKFNPSAPQDASIELEIPVSGITTGNAQADQALPSADWFAAADHPVAKFTAKGFKPAGANSYEIKGMLKLKGHSEEVTVAASITSSDDPDNPQSLIAQATGEAKLSRTAFKIGEGQWASTATIADEVIVSFRFTAHRAK